MRQQADIVLATGAHLKIVEAASVTELRDILKEIPGHATIFLDVDDTIIAPVSSSFRIHYTKTLMEEIKANAGEYGDIQDILCAWRLNRHIMLIGEDWPHLIDDLKASYPVYGLTRMNPGRAGSMESAEKWRESELRGLGIVFTQNKNAEAIKSDVGYEVHPVFYGGLLFTGSASKGDTIDCFNRVLAVKFVVMVDDRMDHLQSIEEFCKNEGIGFLGVCFKGAETLPGTYDHKLAAFQKDYLVKNHKWLEDDTARAMMKMV